MVYETVNLVVRRSAKENNFKGILETIRRARVLHDVDDHDLQNTTKVAQNFSARRCDRAQNSC